MLMYRGDFFLQYVHSFLSSKKLLFDGRQCVIPQFKVVGKTTRFNVIVFFEGEDGVKNKSLVSVCSDFSDSANLAKFLHRWSCLPCQSK